MAENSLNPHFELDLGGEKRELFMSYGLVNTLATAAGSPERLTFLSVDHDLRRVFLHTLVQQRSKSGKVEHEVDPDDLPLTPEEVVRLLKWGVEHTLDFFIRTLTAASEVSEANKDRLISLVSSLIGSKT